MARRKASADWRYLVVWEIDSDARSPREAAKKALEIQRDPRSAATVFYVTDRRTGERITIDLEEEDPKLKRRKIHPNLRTRRKEGAR